MEGVESICLFKSDNAKYRFMIGKDDKSRETQIALRPERQRQKEPGEQRSLPIKSMPIRIYPLSFFLKLPGRHKNRRKGK